MSHTILDITPEKKQIDARAKDGKSYEVDGESRFCGHRFILKQKMYGDKRCIYCGKWFHWDQANQQKWIRTNNLDPYNNDLNIEPLHCGSSHCEEYHALTQKAQERTNAELDARGMKLFKELKQKGVL